MTRIVSTLEAGKPRKRLFVSAALLAGFSMIAAVTFAAFQFSDAREMVRSAKAEIESCTIRGVGAAIANGQFSLSLPAGCRLSG